MQRSTRKYSPMTRPASEPTAITTSLRGDVAVVTIQRPSTLNALRVVDKRDIRDQLTAAVSRGARVVIVTGGGDKSFCSGSDLKEMSGLSAVEFRNMEQVEADMYDAIMNSPVPVIAAVNGWALGTGCVLTAVCDIAIADPHAQFGQPEVLNGAPTPIHGAILPRVIGVGHARWLAMTGRTIDASTAERWGLVSSVARPGRALDSAMDLASQLAADTTAESSALQKHIVNTWIRYPFDAAVESSIYVASSAYETDRPHTAAERVKNRHLRSS